MQSLVKLSFLLVFYVTFAESRKVKPPPPPEPKPGEFDSLLTAKVKKLGIKFTPSTEEGGYFPLRSNNDTSIGFNFTELFIEEFFILSSGRSKLNSSDLWIERDTFSNDALNFERITGVIGWTIEMFEGVLILETPNTPGRAQTCDVIGTSRQFSPVGRTNDFTGNQMIKIFFQDTIIKKPFTYVVNDYILDASTRPVYPVAGGNVDQRFHLNFQVNPKCHLLGLSRDEFDQLDRLLNRHLRDTLRQELMYYIRKRYFLEVIQPYAKSIDADIGEDDYTEMIQAQTVDWKLCYVIPDHGWCKPEPEEEEEEEEGEEEQADG